MRLIRASPVTGLWLLVIAFVFTVSPGLAFVGSTFTLDSALVAAEWCLSDCSYTEVSRSGLDTLFTIVLVSSVIEDAYDMCFTLQYHTLSTTSPAKRVATVEVLKRYISLTGTVTRDYMECVVLEAKCLCYRVTRGN